MYSIYEYERAEQTITINGVTMTVAEYKKLQRKNKRNQRKAAMKNEIRLLPKEVKTLLKSAKVMRSLSAYYDWSYKMWGRIAKTIIHDRDIESPFLQYRIKAREMEQIVNDINRIGGKGEKDVFQYILKLSWKMAEIREQLTLLYNGVKESGVCRQFKDHECIVGSKDGKRLGLSQLMHRVYKAIDDLDVIVKKLDNIEKEGVDVLRIENTMTKKESKRVC